MSKELEALERMCCATLEEDLSVRDIYENEYDLVKSALQRLEAIDNAEPNEALECSLKLYKMVDSAGNGKGFDLNEAWKYHETIKQALIKSEKEHNSVNLLMQELDCKDFAELRKYARCGYQTFRNVEKEHKALEIIKEKNVSIFWIKECKSVEEYNYYTANYMELTQEEFNLLKEVLGE